MIQPFVQGGRENVERGMAYYPNESSNADNLPVCRFE